ncbi:Membrane protein involved in the export of O-antigen and teichoic acid [Fervidobacterium changbaicum]|uniref:Lipopolysaccharide biosynthesis protein n=4 Tax=Fervidobacterium TaxID=2422 RepID=A0A7V4CM18_FERPE|nr:MULTISPECIES: oligosaccharide flippase family protein [Fervidobacterium]AMW32008.1 oligosaccharide flippase family protein [Fervidobacterium islandicum]QAV33790.1 polysaccharide biosynthesis protein [Fervidobacterium changbaicum]SDH78468.1 Membrane protein involved in the export of O-antigen and teichoic acid [Fervidobacterium changbaicum]
MKKYIKSYFSFSLGIWLKAFISVVTAPIISYLISPEEFGKASMFLVAFSVLNIIALLGTDQAYVRFFNEYEKEKRAFLFSNSLYTSLISATFISMIILIADKKVSLLLYGSEHRFVNLLLVITVYISIFQTFNQFTVMMEGNGFLYSLINVANTLVTILSTIFFALMLNRSFYAIVLGNLFGYLAAIVVGATKTPSYWKLRRMNWTEVKKILAFGVPLVPTFLVSWVYTSIDRISLRQYGTLEEIGLYSAAYRIVTAINIIQGGFSSFWISTAYKEYEKDKNNTQFFKKAHDMVGLVLFIVAFLVLGFKDVIFLIFSKSYRVSANIAPFLILMPILYSLSETTVGGINFTKKTYWHFVILIVCAATNFLGNSMLVPLYGAKGAAVSTGLSYVMFYFMRTLISEKVFRVGYDLRKSTIGIVLLIIAAGIGTLTSKISVNLLVMLTSMGLVVLVYKEEASFLLGSVKQLLKSKSDNSW